MRQPLPLNVRELHALLLKAVNASTGDVVRLPMQDPTPVPEAPPPRSGEEHVEKEAKGYVPPGSPSRAQVIACLEREEWNVSRVARVLNLHRNALIRLMKSYGIEKDRVA